MAEAYWHVEGKRLGWQPMQAKGFTKATGLVSHWWLERNGVVLDLSRKQFGQESFPYERGRHVPFLSQKPSKRAIEIIFAAGRLMVQRTVVRVSVNGLKIRQNQADGGRRLIFRKERGGKITYHNQVTIPAEAKLVYRPKKPLKCGARAWIEWVE